MTEPFKPVAVTFLRAMSPYESGDVVGLLHDHAHTLVQKRIADFFPPTANTATSEAGEVPADLLDDMDRAQLVAFGREHLGMKDEPPASIADAALREAIRANVDPALLVIQSEDGDEDDSSEQDQDKSGARKPGKGGKPKP